jgi:hypothetical protein
MKKNNEKAATTARISRGSMGASRVNTEPRAEFVVLVIGREYHRHTVREAALDLA